MLQLLLADNAEKEIMSEVCSITTPQQIKYLDFELVMASGSTESK